MNNNCISEIDNMLLDLNIDTFKRMAIVGYLIPIINKYYIDKQRVAEAIEKIRNTKGNHPEPDEVDWVCDDLLKELDIGTKTKEVKR